MNKPEIIRQGKRVRWEGWDAEWLRHQYITLNKSTTEMSDEFGPSRFALAKWLRRAGIVKSKTVLAENHGKCMTGVGNPAWNGGITRKYQRRLLEREQPDMVCKWCGSRSKVQLHHEDHEPTNGDLANLSWLCGTCNRLEAHLWALKQNGIADVTIGAHQIKIQWRK